MTSHMSYGWFGDEGTIDSSASALASASADVSADASAGTRGESSRLLLGRNDSSSRISAMHSWSLSTAKWATPLVALCVSAPPSSSFVTSS